MILHGESTAIERNGLRYEYDERVRELENAERDLVELLVGAKRYRDAEGLSDATGEWEPAREAAVDLDTVIERLTRDTEPSA